MTRSDTDIGQSIEQSNDCGGSTTCTTRTGMKQIVFGSCDSGDNEFDSSLDIYQSIEQSKACSGLLPAVIQQVT
jgi:predicted nucleotidyltransferase